MCTGSSTTQVHLAVENNFLAVLAFVPDVCGSGWEGEQRSWAQGVQCKHSGPVASLPQPRQFCGEKPGQILQTVPEDTGENIGRAVSYRAISDVVICRLGFRDGYPYPHPHTLYFLESASVRPDRFRPEQLRAKMLMFAFGNALAKARVLYGVRIGDGCSPAFFFL